MVESSVIEEDFLNPAIVPSTAILAKYIPAEVEIQSIL